jgi:hypothetical protein
LDQLKFTTKWISAIVDAFQRDYAMISSLAREVSLNYNPHVKKQYMEEAFL